MKRIFIPVMIIFAAIVFMASKKVTEHTKWLQGPVKADGVLKEWPSMLSRYDENTRIAYSIANDRKNLYLAMVITDEAMQRKIIMGGMEFRIDTGDKKNYPVSVFFPMPGHWNGPKPVNPNDVGDYRPGERPQKQNPPVVEVSQVQVTGFKGIPDGIIPWHNDFGIEVAIKRDSLGSLVYEAVIPFRTFYKEELTPNDSTTVFRFSYLIKGVTGVRQGGGPARGEGGFEGGEGGREGGHHMGGGEHPGGGQGPEGMNGGPPSSNNHASITEQNEIKARLHLMYK